MPEKVNKPSSFLIIQTASIGDVVLATPLIEKLSFYFPDAQIDFLLKKGTEGVLSNNPKINNLIIWNKSEKKYKNLYHTIRMIRRRKYDFVIVVQRFFTAGLIAFLSKSKLISGFNKNPFSWFFNYKIIHQISKNIEKSTHEINRNLCLIEKVCENPDEFPMKIYPSKHDDARMSQYKTQAYICIAPASLWFTKQYPVEKWIEFVSQIDPELRIYFLGSPDDYITSENINHTANLKNALNLCGKLTFMESASLMQNARMNFVNDSAPQHLASAVNAPVTSIFCSTVPAFGFGPKSSSSFIVETTVHLNCRPCGLHGFKSCPEKHFKCANSIKADQLLKTIPEYSNH